MQWSSAGSGTEACHARSPTKVDENCPNCSISGLSSRRQAPVESDSKDVQEFGGAGTRSCASSRPARWQRGGQRNLRRKRAIASAEFSTRGFWTTAPPIAQTECRKSRSWSEELQGPSQSDGIIAPLLVRSSSWCRSARFLLSKTSKTTVPRSRVQRLLSSESSASPRFTASCCSDGLAVIQLLWRRVPDEQCQHQFGKATAAQLTLLNQPHMAAFHPHLATCVRFRPLVPLLPCRSVVIAASETGVHQDMGSVMGGS